MSYRRKKVYQSKKTRFRTVKADFGACNACRITIRKNSFIKKRNKNLKNY